MILFVLVFEIERIEKIKLLKYLKNLEYLLRFFIVDKHPNGGIYGCFDSHIKIVQYMQKNNKNNILIFEDDVEPTASFDISHIENAVKFMKLNQILIPFVALLFVCFASIAEAQTLSKSEKKILKKNQRKVN